MSCRMLHVEAAAAGLKRLTSQEQASADVLLTTLLCTTCCCRTQEESYLLKGGLAGGPADCPTLSAGCFCRTQRSAAQEEASADALLAALERSVRLRRAADNEPTMDHR